MKTMVCRRCRRELPEEQFEMYRSGTRRRICRHCHYVAHVREAVGRWRMKERAEALMRASAPRRKAAGPP